MANILKVVAVVQPGSEFQRETTSLFSDVQSIKNELAQDTPWLIYAGPATGALYAKEVKVG